MSDGRKNNGGARPGAGRPKKADEIKKLEMMDSIAEPKKAWKALWKLVEGGDVHATKFWIEHRFGKAKSTFDVTTDGQPIGTGLNLSNVTTEELLILAKMHDRNEVSSDD